MSITVTDYETLARLPGETARAYAAFLDYVRLGDGRSLRGLLEQYAQAKKRGQTEGKARAVSVPTVRQATLEQWSTRWRWQERLAAYQAERARREQAVWEQRRAEVREYDWALGQALRERIEQMLAKSERWSIGDVLRALELASKLQRLAAEVLPPKQTHEMTGLGGEPVKIVVTWANDDEALSGNGDAR